MRPSLISDALRYGVLNIKRIYNPVLEKRQTTGMNSWWLGRSSSLDTGQRCLAEAWPQAPPVRRRVPYGNRPQALRAS